MIKHVVMWKFKPDCEAEVEEFLSGLKSLYGQIESLKSLEIGENELTESDFDAVLIAEFEDAEGLDAYKNDPRHLALSALCKSIRTARHSVDYFIPQYCDYRK